jgi:hypothetical protein
MSACDAVDGSSTGTEVPWMWVLLIVAQIKLDNGLREGAGDASRTAD